MLAFSKTLSNPAIDQLAKINLKFSVARKHHFSSERERKRTFINDIIIHKAGGTLAATAKETNHFPRIRVIEYLFVKHVMLCKFFHIFICRVCKVNVQLVHIFMHRTYRAYIAEKYVFSIIPCYSMRDTHLLVRVACVGKSDQQISRKNYFASDYIATRSHDTSTKKRKNIIEDGEVNSLSQIKR